MLLFASAGITLGAGILRQVPHWESPFWYKKRIPAFLTVIASQAKQSLTQPIHFPCLTQKAPGL